MALLVMMLICYASTAHLPLIDRETGLRGAAASYPPIVAMEVIGLANKLADALSRRFAPSRGCA